MPTAVLVTGGTSLTGRRVARQYMNSGYHPRIGSRRAEPPFDWCWSHTWLAVLSPTDRTDRPRAAYLCYPSDIGAPSAAERVDSFIAQAERHGLERVALLTAQARSNAKPAEDAVRNSSSG